MAFDTHFNDNGAISSLCSFRIHLSMTFFILLFMRMCIKYARWLEFELDFKTIHTELHAYCLFSVRLFQYMCITQMNLLISLYLSPSVSVPLFTFSCALLTAQWKLNMEFIGKYLSQNNCRNSSNRQRVLAIAIRNDCICLYVLLLQ